MAKEKLMSGMRPTGKLHLGHYIGVLSNWVKLQDDYQCYFSIADLHALTTKYDKTENLKTDILNVVLDWLASGIDPNKSNIYIQSLIPQVSQLHVLLSMITPNNWVERDPTLKDMVKILKDKQECDNKDSSYCSISYGLLGYPVLMATDIIGLNAKVVPVGIDQVAHIEIARDIARRFNYLYKTDFFIEPVAKLTEIPLLLGIDGQKMGKSFNNDIKISDTEEDTTKKIMKCITDPNRARKTDPGNTDNCEVAFKYYKAFADNDTLTEIKNECTLGKIGCVDCKRRLACLMNNRFRPIREKRIDLEKNIDTVKDIINEGSKRTRKEAQNILDQVNNIMGMYT